MTAVVAVFSRAFPMGTALGKVGGLLLAGLRWLFSLWQPKDTDIPDMAPMPQAAPEMPGFMLNEAAEKAYWVELLETIIMYLILILVALAILAAIVYGVYQFYKKFYGAPPADGDVREYIRPELNAETMKMFWNGLWRRDAGLRGVGDPVRRAYYKKVKRHIRKGAVVRPSFTTKEIGLSIQPREDISELTLAYEQTRYGKTD